MDGASLTGINSAALKYQMVYDVGVFAMNNLAVKIRKALLKSMMWTFPVSSYLWAIGALLVGLLYIFDPRWYPPAEIQIFADTVWGVCLTLASLLMIYCMIKERGWAINVLSFIIALFATSLFIASVVDYRPVSAIASGLTAIYYSYSYLCAHLITEWRVIDKERLERLHKELDH